jgi:hypothetical protein
MPRLRFTPVVCAIACAAAFPAAVSATATHDSARGTEVTENVHDLNICGLPGTFNMVTRFEWHSTEVNGGYHFQMTEVSRWTVTLDDPGLGVWSGRGTDTFAFTASPGDVLTSHEVFNGSEGPVRIHEHQTFVVGADGNLKVSINQVTTDYGACPS